MAQSGQLATGPLRLVAQDIGFSVQRQGFDSPRGYFYKPRVLFSHAAFLRAGSLISRMLCPRRSRSLARRWGWYSW